MDIFDKNPSRGSGWTIGTDGGVQPGDAAIAAIGDPLDALFGLAVAAAAVAVFAAIARHFLAPDDDSLGRTLVRVRRVLMVVAFLSVCGSVFIWVVQGTTSSDVPGLEYLGRWS